MTLPPNQQLVAPGKWPLVGERMPRESDAPWTVTLAGACAAPQTWTLDELASLPQVERIVDIHCVTRWSKLGCRFTGVLFATLLAEAKPCPTARFASFIARSTRHHSTSLPLDAALELGTLCALSYEGKPLATEHGGPVRTIVPSRYFYKSLKWLERIELLSEDRLGFWEATAGYHNHADPWREERYLAPALDRQAVRRLITARDVSARDLRGLDAAGRDLAGLNARTARLRHADFRAANLQDADFHGANLSNAHFERADCRGARFVDADCEGADFRGADLRQADFTGASLFGATFCDAGESMTLVGSALLDASTRIHPPQLDALTPPQLAFVQAALTRN